MESTTRNEVLLVGRLAAGPEERALPSGDVLTTFRLVVDRPPAARKESARPVTVDTIDCVGRRASVLRATKGWQAGDLLEVHGALRRRFFRTAAGTGSRYEVEVAKGRRLPRPA